ncbi:MAG: cysteine desulfurase [Gammaproteobacteria bacterium]|nr:cysteine desulfurase [Gammaproteobacteria bacterium]MCH9715546.1 cysteine desulfurase [Gammaproteobacteria bacterium]MCH9764347.1 cysteine desulfurase [Gammaproteobacteria bacterium]
MSQHLLETQVLDIDEIRHDFPVLHQAVNGHPLVYLDNAATTQKPRTVMNVIKQYYEEDNANVHRGVHALSVRATEKYEKVREQVCTFIGASSIKECIFVRGTTEAINLVAQSFVLPRLSKGDEILITALEHHANIVPWQMICEQSGAVLQVVPMTNAGEVSLQAFEAKLSKKTKFVAVSHASNAIGTINPVHAMVKAAHAYDVPVLVDGAQAVAHLSVDVAALGCDFYAFSGHKMYAPTGIGVLWGREELLNAMRPYQGGGEMIAEVRFDGATYAELPYKFEAGTPNISGVIGLGAALTYLSALDRVMVSAYETTLFGYATEVISGIEGFRIIGTASCKLPIISLVHDTVHAHDVGTILDSLGIAMRSGHHCAMPLMDFFDVPATTRLSLAFYNTREDINRCVEGLHQVNRMFS